MPLRQATFLGGGGTSEPTSMRIGDVYLEAIVDANESGGTNAPTKKTEAGYDFTSSTGAEPVTASFEAYIEPRVYGQLADLRDTDRPFSVTVGFVSLGQCVLDDLEVNESASTLSHFSVTISVSQVQTARTGTATLIVDSTDGSGNGSTQSGSADIQQPTLVRTQAEDTEGGPDGEHPRTDAVKEWLGF